ncbi:MAG: hypothetical protein ACLR4Z_15475 [Butyricicoccaceae bacterium]
MKNNWNELKDIKAPQELKERTLAAAREARKLTNEPLHAVPRHPWGMAKRLLAAACAFGIVLGGTAVYRTHNGTAQTGECSRSGCHQSHIRLCSLCRRYRRAASAEGQQDRVRHRQRRGLIRKGFLLRLSVQGDGRGHQDYAPRPSTRARSTARKPSRIHRPTATSGCVRCIRARTPNSTVPTP